MNHRPIANTISSQTDLERADRRNHWHGFTQMSTYESMLIDSAEGSWLIADDGRRFLDGVSSLWCNLHGHRHPRIDAAIRDQLDRVAHVTNIGMGCTTTARLASGLAAIAPADLNHVFFSSDGASAVEVAIKMAFQHWHQSGSPSGKAKTRYLTLGSAYHGDTVGTVSLGDIPLFHDLFEPLLFKPLRGPLPDSYRLPAGVSSGNACDYYAEQFESLFNKHHATLAALVIEPLVQGAAGLVMHPPGLLTRLRELCERFDLLLIADEIATGFGRTGLMFACEHESVAPDILCLGKGLTGGYLPMAATIASTRVFESFLVPTEASSGRENSPQSANRQFFHGHTYSGNPLAAAASLASLDLLQEEHFFPLLGKKINQLAAELRPLQQHPHVGDVRQLGMMIGIELVEDKTTRRAFASSARMGRRVCDESTRRGVWVRPLGDVVVLMPPLSITTEEITILTSTVASAIEATFDSL